MIKIINYFLLCALSCYTFATNDSIFYAKLNYNNYITNNIAFLFKLKEFEKNCIISPFCNNRLVSLYILLIKYPKKREYLESYNDDQLVYYCSFLSLNENDYTIKIVSKIKFVFEFKDQPLYLTNSYFFVNNNYKATPIKSVFVISRIYSLYKRDKSDWEILRVIILDGYFIDIILPSNKPTLVQSKQNDIIIKLVKSLNKLGCKDNSYLNIKIPLFKIEYIKDISDCFEDYMLKSYPHAKHKLVSKYKIRKSLMQGVSINQKLSLEFTTKHSFVTATTQTNFNSIDVVSEEPQPAEEPKLDFIVDRAFFVVISKINHNSKNTNKHSVILIAKIENPTLTS